MLPKEQIDRLEGFAATRAEFLQARLDHYRFIHIASHGIADSEIPQLSALILSTIDRQGRPIDGQVFAADLVNTRLNAEVVVLSACETALGKEVVGEGLIGLRYVMLARGARSVVASLWQVPDRAAAELMASFYASLLRDDLSVVAASGAAMRAMLSGQLQDPALWGAFAVVVRAPPM